MHESLFPEHASQLAAGLPEPPCPIFDAHMHASEPHRMQVYVREARRYGVTGALALMHRVTPRELREAFGDFFIPCTWGRVPLPEEGDAWTREMVARLDRDADAGARVLKFKVDPSKGRPPAMLDDPRLAPVLARAAERGIFLMAHIAQPSAWWPERYAPDEVGTKESYFPQIEAILTAHPELVYIGAHFGGFPEDLDYLATLLERCPNAHLDTSATKWVVRELSRRPEAARAFVLRFPDRILFGSDLVVMKSQAPDYYTSRFHVLRTFFESDAPRPSMIRDPDATGADFPGGPEIRPLALPEAVLRRVYRENAARLLGLPGAAPCA